MQGTPEDRSSCPTPLSWKDVLGRFSNERDCWVVESQTGWHLSGGTLGSGTPLYIFPGLLGSSEQFALLAHLLQSDTQLVLLDYPSRKDNPGKLLYQSTFLEEFADLFSDILERHQHSSASIYGTGFGSLLAIHCAQKLADQVQGLILQAGQSHRRLSLAERVFLQLLKRLPGTVGSLPGHQKIQRNNHRQWFPPFDQSRWDYFWVNVSRTSLSDWGSRALWMHKTDLTETLSQIQTPTLLIRTEGEGSITKRNMELLAEKLTTVEEEWLAGCGHQPYLTHPHRLNGVISSFFQQRNLQYQKVAES